MGDAPNGNLSALHATIERQLGQHAERLDSIQETMISGFERVRTDLRHELTMHMHDEERASVERSERVRAVTLEVERLRGAVEKVDRRTRAVARRVRNLATWRLRVTALGLGAAAVAGLAWKLLDLMVKGKVVFP